MDDGKSEVRASDVEQGAKPFLGGVQRGIVAEMEMTERARYERVTFCRGRSPK